nr:glycosyltransferase family 2 protein [uncultured Flavobacterium sp.]
MDTDSPLITIITVCYNVSSTIEKTILSVINQNFSDFEYIIIDGGSTDDTLEIIKKYKDRISFWLSEPDAGIYDAMNKGIKLATGEWINFMNAGDVFYDMQILKKVFSIDRFSDVIYGDNMLCYRWGNIVLAPDDIEKTRDFMVFGHQTVFAKSKLLLKYLFDTNYKIAADYDLFFRIYIDNHIFEYIPICICKFSAYDGASTNNPLITFLEDSKINARNKNKNWKLILFLYKMRLNLRKYILLLLPVEFIENTKRKNILKNKLIKRVILND